MSNSSFLLDETGGLPVSFNPKVLGQSFREISVDVIEGEKVDLINRLLRSHNQEAELMIWTDGEKRMIKHQICFFGQIVEWSPIHGTRTGMIVEEEYDNDSEVKSSDEGSDPETDGRKLGIAENVQFDQKAQATVVDQAVRLLKYIRGVSESDRQALIFNLRESPKMHKAVQKRALETWAPESHGHVGFWRRFRTWLVG